jgi:hypothetical protein
VLKRAKEYDCKRLQSSAPIQCNDSLMHTVNVLSHDYQTVLYTMKQPDQVFAACSCDVSVQKKMCKHQVAYLLQQSWNKLAAERLIYRYLGTRFGFLGGADERSIECLWEELQGIPPTGTAECAPQQITATHPPAASTQDANGRGLVPLPVAPRQSFMSATVLAELKVRLQLDLQDTLRYLDDCPADARKNLASQLKSILASAKDAARSAAEGVLTLPGSEFQKTGSGGLLRKRGFMERSKQSKGKNKKVTDATKMTQDDAHQADFAHRSKCGAEKLQVSKVWKHCDTAAEAAKYLQACINQQAAASVVTSCRSSNADTKVAGGVGDEQGGAGVEHVHKRHRSARSNVICSGTWAHVLNDGDDSDIDF